MPLSLGWDADPQEEEVPPGSHVLRLLLSDIKSGATRPVAADWMHALHKHIIDTYEPGTIVVQLQEAGYMTRFGWGHALLLATYFIQVSFVLFAMTHGQIREGWLILAASLICIFEGSLAWAYPKYLDPRLRATPRFYALHTGPTNYILVLIHRFRSRGECINLEDNGASIITAADGFAIPLVLLLGTSVLEFVSQFSDMLPAMSEPIVLHTGISILDRVTAACQFTDSISVGFVENILPDPRGQHTDYKWISEAMEAAVEPLPLHSTHLSADVVQSSTDFRRRANVSVALN
ncbi:hypothetical protein DFH08DRAFT_802396 [Mycena albidolilacea]|uniref:Uncharacterized protein n=1 Tax=Mycena albidolilacea TaxID=1033008 RepID=A0AAD7AH98_9AGAR|nr:hypothetical protein DFH08DRAFT_802396 [Mycena albidolilacea]